MPLLTRQQDSTIAAFYLVSLLLAAGGEEELKPTEVLALHVVLASLICQNPHDLPGQITEWIAEQVAHGPDSAQDPEQPADSDGQQADEGRAGQTNASIKVRDLPRLNSGSPLSPADLGAWVRYQGGDFLDGLGPLLERALEPYIWIASTDREPFVESSKAGVLDLPEESRRGGLRHFPSLTYLFLHAIRDVLRLAVDLAPQWEKTSEIADIETEDEIVSSPSQSDLMADPEALIERLEADREFSG